MTINMNQQEIIKMLEQEWHDRLAAAVLAEREACADVAALWDLGTPEGHAIADAIRARSET